MPTPHLPDEIIDMILYHVFTCPRHPWSSSARPCQSSHTPSLLPSLMHLRLVCKDFSRRLEPTLFHDMSCRGVARRHRTLVDVSRHRLGAFVRVLRIEIAPSDLGGRMRRINSANATSEKKLLSYFEVLPIFLVPVLKRFEHVTELDLAASYLGILDRRIPKNEAMNPCLDALCHSIKKANMTELERVSVAAPYEGGYLNFFEDLDDQKYTRLLRACGKNVHSGSVKLFDHQGNFTTMPFF